MPSTVTDWLWSVRFWNPLPATGMEVLAIATVPEKAPAVPVPRPIVIFWPAAPAARAAVVMEAPPFTVNGLAVLAVDDRASVNPAVFGAVLAMVRVPVEPGPAPEVYVAAALNAQYLQHQLAMAELRNQHLVEQARARHRAG